MALGSTVVTFDIELSDVDRNHYASLALKLAQHPSEPDARLVARAIAWALEHDEGIEVLDGMPTSDTPPLCIRDLTGALTTWIDLGTPDAARLHRASKAADRVAVYCHKDTGAWLKGLQGQKIHAPERIALHALPPRELEAFAAGLARRNAWSLSRVEGQVWLESGDSSLSFDSAPLTW
ncbi:MAG: YaeQ family protein [Alphaproteobacteria bacterium]|nr:YaeQ family protein [Alphaproteobacteria bacterium]